MKRLDFERGCLAGLQSRNDQHVLDNARDAVGVLAHDAEVVARDVAFVDHVILEQIFEITIDDGQRRAEFVRGVGDKVLADLFGLMLGSEVADDHAGGRAAAQGVRQARRVNTPGIDAAIFRITERRALLR